MDPFWESVFETIRQETDASFLNPEPCPVGGGCINEAFLVETESGPGFFVKVNAAEKLPMFEAEADALATLAATATIRVPGPLCFGRVAGKAFLALEAIPMSSRSDPESQEKMGRQLAALHQVVSENGQFGWHRDNTIGELPQRNSWTPSWTEFFTEHRLRYQFEMAAARGRAIRKSEELLEKIPELLDGHDPDPSLLHGDLWGGNAAFDAEGEPVVYDPATYHGDRETDLAFTEMFGGFGPAFRAGYHAAWPLEPGYDNRKHLYNLYHVVNHHNHFGGGYAAQAESIIERLLAI